MNPELQRMGRIRDVLFLLLMAIFVFKALITTYALAHNIFILEVFIMRLIIVGLVVAMYLVAVKIVKKYEDCIKKCNP